MIIYLPEGLAFGVCPCGHEQSIYVGALRVLQEKGIEPSFFCGKCGNEVKVELD